MTETIKAGSAPHLFCFGLGYSARVLVDRLVSEGWAVSGTCRDEPTRQALAADGIRAHLFDRDHPLHDPVVALSEVTDVLISVPPDGEGDPVLDRHGADIASMTGLRWIGYLSTTGVYGNTGGLMVDETAPLNPTSDRSSRRIAAEQRWLELYRSHQRPVHLFRLAGIYGPGRSAIDQVRAGRARRIDKPGHKFSRIHVEDLASTVRASMARPDHGAIYNVCDDVPASQSDVVAYACALLGVTPPTPVPLEELAGEMSQMALSFWRDNRLVDNSRMKLDLGAHLRYPDYRSGLQAILKSHQNG